MLCISHILCDFSVLWWAGNVKGDILIYILCLFDKKNYILCRNFKFSVSTSTADVKTCVKFVTFGLWLKVACSCQTFEQQFCCLGESYVKDNGVDSF